MGGALGSRVNRYCNSWRCYRTSILMFDCNIVKIAVIQCKEYDHFCDVLIFLVYL